MRSPNVFLTAIISLLFLSNIVHSQMLEHEGRIIKIDSTDGRNQFEAKKPIQNINNYIWSYDLDQLPSSEYYRLKLIISNVGENDRFIIDIKNSNFRKIDTIYSSEIDSSREYWTNEIRSDFLSVHLSGDISKGFIFKVDSVAHTEHGGNIEFFSVTKPNQIMPVYEIEKKSPTIYKVSSAVAKLNIIKSTNKSMASCSGFLIDNDKLVTNYHCVSNNQECKSLTAVFGYQKLSDGSIDELRQYRCKEILFADEDYDITSIKLKQTPSNIYHRMKISKRDLEVGEHFSMIHHPGGLPKMATIDGCKVIELKVESPTSKCNIDFSHRCDSAGSSSGAPILNDKGEVIAVHHWGFEKHGAWADLNRALPVSEIFHLIEP